MVSRRKIRARDTVKGMVPGHVCIVQVSFDEVCFTQGYETDA